VIRRLFRRMDSEQFGQAGRQMIDYVIDYLENIRDRRVFPTVKPGFMRELIPAEAPEKPESWDAVFQDIERVIMPGVSCISDFSTFSFVVFSLIELKSSVTTSWLLQSHPHDNRF
jgi:hypothetical protein